MNGRQGKIENTGRMRAPALLQHTPQIITEMTRVRNGPRDEKPASKRLSYGAANTLRNQFQ
jgi:hypothetical protein